MGHTDPVVVVPAGLLFTVGSTWLAVAPERFLGYPGTRGLERFLGERATRALLRVCGLLTAALCARLTLHAAAAVAGA